MNDRALRNRQKKVREGMSRAGADCLIVTRPANVTYITGFLGEDSWAMACTGWFLKHRPRDTRTPQSSTTVR